MLIEKCLTTLYQPCLQNIPLKAVVFSNKKICAWLSLAVSVAASACCFLEISKGIS